MISETKKNVVFADLAESREFAQFYNILRKLTGIKVILIDGFPTSQTKWLFRPEEMNPLCMDIRSKPEGLDPCNACDRVHCEQAIREQKGIEYLCHAGLVDFVVPIYIEARLLALFMGGQILLEPPTEKGFEKLQKNVKDLNLDLDQLRKTYFLSPFLTREKFREALDLLTFFAEYFCEMGIRLKAAGKENTHPNIDQATQFIRQHLREPIGLPEVARHIGLSAAYSGVLFKKMTGIGFAHYLQQLRVSETKKLLTQTIM